MATLCSARLHFFPGIATLAFLSMAVPASADPFAITSGVLAFVPVSATPSEITVRVFNLSGPDFAIPGGDSNPEEFVLRGLAIATADPFAVAFPVSGQIVVDLSAPLTVRNVSLPVDCCARVLLDLTFRGVPVASRQTTDGVAGTGAFSVIGELLAFQGDVESPPVFRHAIAGSGVARVGFLLGGEEPPRAFATYMFEPPAPVPEPGTLVLFGAGAAMLVRRRTHGADRAALNTSFGNTIRPEGFPYATIRPRNIWSLVRLS